MKLYYLSLLAVLSSFAPILAETSSTQLVDSRGTYIFSQSGVTGMVLVVVHDREVLFRSYGETFPGSSQRPRPNSLLRLCSLSKIFTTDLLVKLIIDGAVHLTDPLQRFAPAGKVVPNQTLHGVALRPVTLGDLATHTSGLPREVGLYPIRTAHFTFPDYNYRWAWLPKQRLITSPGTAASYSNIGFDLLGDALASAAGKPYSQLFSERTAQPLGLRDTTLTPSLEQCSRLLRGSADEGPCTDTQASAGSGGMYSSPEDMTRFLQYVLHVPGMPAQPSSALAVYLQPAQLSSVQGLDHAGKPTGIGLGWIRLGEPGSSSVVLEKTGGGAGFGTYIALIPGSHTGLFIAATEGVGDTHFDFLHEVNNLLTDLAHVPALPVTLPRPKALVMAKRNPHSSNPLAVRRHRARRRTA